MKYTKPNYDASLLETFNLPAAGASVTGGLVFDLRGGSSLPDIELNFDVEPLTIAADKTVTLDIEESDLKDSGFAPALTKKLVTADAAATSLVFRPNSTSKRYFRAKITVETGAGTFTSKVATFKAVKA